MPSEAHAGHPTVSFSAPAGGSEIAGVVPEGPECEVAASGNTRAVDFYIDGALVSHNDYAPWNCDFDSRRLGDGRHALKAVARAANGESAYAEVQIQVDNSGRQTRPPTVAFRGPAGGAHIAGVVPEGPECEVAASIDTRAVDFYIDGTFVSHNGYAPWNCQYDSSRLSDGPHALKAVVRDTDGNSAYAEVGINVSNGRTTPEAAKATTRPVGTPTLSDSAATSRVSRSAWEPRPNNARENSRIPTEAELARAGQEDRSLGGYRPHITGAFRGTTDEIIQWAAWKWGFDEDVFRAVASLESWWDQSSSNDCRPVCVSRGLYQHKVRNPAAMPTTNTLVKESTPFNADYYGAKIRYYYEGNASWLNDPCCSTGVAYRAGDLWGSIGAYYSGAWHDSGAERYIAAVKDYLQRKVWKEPDFAGYVDG